MTTDVARPPGTQDASADTWDEILDVIHNFGQALDTNDWVLYRACLSDTVDVDYTEATGLPPARTSGDAWTAFVRACVDPQTTVHYYTNIRIRVPTATDAEVVLNHQSCHRVETKLGSATNIQYGTYDLALAFDAGWRIRRIHHHVSWIDGNGALLDTSGEAWRSAARNVFGAAIR